jgi:hypothetical protein
LLDADIKQPEINHECLQRYDAVHNRFFSRYGFAWLDIGRGNISLSGMGGLIMKPTKYFEYQGKTGWIYSNGVYHFNGYSHMVANAKGDIAQAINQAHSFNWR